MSAADHSFDLLERRPGWKAEDVLVVTPYVERDFFNRLAGGLRPKRLSVIIDDGCRVDDRSMVTEVVSAIGGRTASGLKCVLGSAPGLMHLKLFYIVWRTPGKRTARTLIFGSANATKQGFGGAVNAELIASCNLTVSKHSEVIAWCEAAIAGARSKSQAKVPAVRDVELGRGMRLRLPALTIGRRKAELASFDLWVQRGWLLAEFRPDPGFLRIPIHLGKALSQTEQERLVATSGFAVPAKKRLTYAYALSEGSDRERLRQEEEEDEGDEGGNWRRKFFVWTQLGEWCSQACHEAEHAHFCRKGLDKRQARLLTLKTMRTPSIRERERSLFIGSLSTLWQQLGEDASTLLRGTDGVDAAYYGQQFDQRVQRDLALVDDREFCKQYLSGYAVNPVPRFRPDVRGWNEFVSSLVQQICLDCTRRHSQSRLPRAVLEAAESIARNDDLCRNPDDLLALLREIFEGGQRGDLAMAKAARIIARYHRD